jgi:succinate dehydrogenase (ubiquinone) membrane anchor subunit
MFASRAVTSLKCLSKPAMARQLPQLTFATSSVRASSGDHVKMWSAERVVSMAQVPACILPFIVTTPMTDAMFCTLAVLHSHWGIEAIVVDYIRPSLFNGSTVIPNICVGLVWALSAVTLGALLYFNYTDVGIINAIKMLWRL